MNTYKSFLILYEEVILPLHKKHPDWIRLDGLIKGGNREVFATFRYQFKTWKIHADTHFSQLIAAYELETGREKPFTASKTLKGNYCLRLSNQDSNDADGLYIYLHED